MEFAPGAARDKGLIKFSRDTDIRRQYWPENVFKHPAKYNIHMLCAIVEYLTTPGQTILDCMAGTGTTMMAAVLGRNVVLLEVEEKYHEMQLYVQNKLDSIRDVNTGSIMTLIGDCRKFLPIPADCVIFSPPYADMLKRKSVSGIAAEDSSSLSELVDYSKSIWNIGNYNYFMYCHMMEPVYEKLCQSAPLMAIVVKDRYKNQERVQFVQDNIDTAVKVGWTLQEHIIFKPQGTEFVNIQKAMGFKAVEDESIVIFRRE